MNLSNALVDNFKKGYFFEDIYEIHAEEVNAFERLYSSCIANYCTQAIWHNLHVVKRIKWTFNDYEFVIDTLDTENIPSDFPVKPLSTSFFNTNKGSFYGTFLQAMECLSGVNKISEFIKLFVKRIHPIHPFGVGYDTSYSSPRLPFSIFISFPSPGGKNKALRLAESIYHEALHLLLTGVERRHPIIITTLDDIKSTYSPWKKEYRPAQGIIHGIFVFKNILLLFRLMLEHHTLSKEDITYLTKRCQEVEHELLMVQGILNDSTLTEFGRDLVKNLLEA